MLSVNIQSLNSKFNALDSLIADLIKNNVDLSLLALQEIWQVDHPDLFEINGYNFFHSQRTKHKGGGIGFYINSELPCRVIPDLSIFHEKIFECLTVEVIINKKKHFISNIYRSPSLITENVNRFLELFEEFLSKLDKSDCPYILLLDSNINLLKLPSCNLSQNYLEMLHNNSFLQLVRKATRIQGKHFSLIDHICVKNDQNPYLTGTLISDISDHFFNFISLSSTKKISTQNSTKGYRLERIINSKTKEKFCDALNEICTMDQCNVFI